MVRHTAVITAILCCLLATVAVGRTWTDRTGRKIEAEYVGFKDGNVRVKRHTDGKEFDVPIEKLSDADQAFVKSQAGPYHGQTPEATQGADQTPSREWRVFYYLVPDVPKERRDFTFILEGVAGGVAAKAHVSPARKCSAEEIERRFGRPDRLQLGEKRSFCSYNVGTGQFPMPQSVTGDVWSFGAIDVMFTDGIASYIWVDAKKGTVEAITAPQASRVSDPPALENKAASAKSPRDTIQGTPTKTDPNVAIASGVLPKYREELAGRNEVRVRNPNAQRVAVAIRLGEAGKNFEVPAEGSASAFVPDGRYDIYFVYANEPKALFQGDSFSLNGNGVEIKLVKIVGGNYGIRRAN